MTYTRPNSLPPEHDPSPGWGQSLDGGAGLALLHIAYAHAGVGDWSTAHQWAKAMTRNGIAAHEGASLFAGSPAVAFVLRAARQPSYARALITLDRHIADLTRQRLGQAHARLEDAQLPELREFDLISGLTGLGAYHLSAGNAGQVCDVLAYLVRLVEPLRADGVQVPGWWTLDGPTGKPDPHWPGGHANLGIAHGIAGPLALLASAALHGITVPGQVEAIDHIERLLDRWRSGTAERTWWPGLISTRDWSDDSNRQSGPQRPSWCYGTPGIARARQLAARARNDVIHQRDVEAALAGCVTDDRQLAQLSDDSLCHGWAGLIHATRRAAAEAEPGSPLIAALSDLTPRWQEQSPRLPDHDGLLEGRAGVALVRAAAAANTVWDACLLTAPPTTYTLTEGTG